MPSNFFSIPKRYTSKALIPALSKNWPSVPTQSPAPNRPTPNISSPAPASPANHTTPSYSQMYNEGPVNQVEEQYFQGIQDWNNDKYKYQGKESSEPKPVVEEKFKHMLAIMGGGSRGGGGVSRPSRPQLPSFGNKGGSFGGALGGGMQNYLQDKMRRRNKFQQQNAGNTQNRLLSRYLGGA